MARAKRLAESPSWDIAIYQDDLILYTVHKPCGPRAMWLAGDYSDEWLCADCGADAFISVKGAELRVGPRRKDSEVQSWASAWLGVPEEQVEVSIKR